MPRRPGQSDSTLETRGKLVALWNEGVSKQEISERVDLSVSRKNLISSNTFVVFAC